MVLAVSAFHVVVGGVDVGRRVVLIAVVFVTVVSVTVSVLADASVANRGFGHWC